MPNWCATDFVFFSKNEESLKKLHQHIKNTALANKKYSDGRASNWMGCVFEDYLNTKDYSCRGFIDDITGITTDKLNDKYSFDLWQSDAWSYHTLIWRDFLMKAYPDVDFVFKAEEPGCELYVVGDPDGLYFTEKYVTDVYFPGCEEREYFDSEEAVINYFKKVFFYKQGLDSIDKIKTYLKNIIIEDDGEFAYIYEFEQVSDE